MLNKETCQTLLPLVNSQAPWDSLKAHLQGLKNSLQDQLMKEQSDLEMRRLQGKLQLVDHLLSLKDEVNEQQKVYLDSGN